MSGPVVFFYVQHLLGIGHLARASRVARALIADGMEVTLVTGGMPVPGFPGTDIPNLALPPIAIEDVAFKGLVDGEGKPATPEYLAARTAMLLDAFARIRPDIVVTEAFPFGRRQVRFELLPLLDAVAAARPKPLMVSSVRDILQKRARLDRDQETVEHIRRSFDLVMVHGDPGFAALEDSFQLAADIADKVAYTGLVCPPLPPPPAERFAVLVSAGGGAVGRELVEAALGAAAQMPDVRPWCILTGPNLPQADFDRLAATSPANVTLARFRKDLASLMQGAGLSVSQAGYNTVAEVLQAGCRALLVPFAEKGETEQSDRATLLARAGRADVLEAEELTPDRMVAAIRAALARPAPQGGPGIAVDGAAQSARVLRAALAKLRGG